MARELAAFAGLGPLRHLDLHHVGIDQIFRGHAEAARGHLLDLGAHRIAVRQRLVAVQFLAAFAGVGLAADAVHGDGKRGVRLAADRAERHGAGREALDDLLGGLDLVERDGLAAHLLGGLDAEHAAQGQQLLGLLVDLLGVGAIFLRQAAAHGVLKIGDHLRAPHMRLAAHAEGIFAADVERVAQHRRSRRRLELWRSTVSRAISSSPTPSTWVLVPVKYLATKSDLRPDGVEDLRAAIGLIGGDAHLRHHFEDALVGRLDVALDRFLGRQLLVELRQPWPRWSRRRDRG